MIEIDVIISNAEYCADLHETDDEDIEWIRTVKGWKPGADMKDLQGEVGKMIKIQDCDLPIQVAEKIISGTKNVSASALDKAAYKAFTGKEIGETKSIDMFDLEEIKEIAGYLMVYYDTHQNGE